MYLFKNIIIIIIIFLVGCKSKDFLAIDGDGSIIADEKLSYITDIAKEEIINNKKIGNSNTSLLFSLVYGYYINGGGYDGKTFVFNRNGVKTIYYDNKKLFETSEYDTIGIYSCELSAVSKFNKILRISKYGYINKCCEIVIPCQFDFADTFSEGFAVVASNINERKKYGIIDNYGNVLVDYVYAIIYRCEAGLFSAIIRENEDINSVIIDSKGQVVLSLPRLHEVKGPICNNKLLIQYPNGYKIIDTTGRTVVDLQNEWEQVDFLSEDRCVIRKGMKFGYIDTFGKCIVSPKYRYATPFYNGMAFVSESQFVAIR